MEIYVTLYDNTLFVDREIEVNLVKERAQALSRGAPVDKRTITFFGGRGAGKTWLLRHLEAAFSRQDEVRAQYLDLLEWADREPSQAVTEIAAQVTSQAREWLGQATADQVGEEVVSGGGDGWLAASIRDLVDRFVLVLLLDHVYESSRAFLESLEDVFLGPVAVQQRVLLVMTGREQTYHWKLLEVRYQVEEHRLEPFDRQLTKQQLQNQNPDAVPRTEEILAISGGYPLGNYLLAARPTMDGPAMRDAADRLLEGIPPEERSWLEALCVLRTFDEESMPFLLATYADDPAILGWPYGRIRQVRDRLLQTHMVRWVERAGGWTVDEAVRPVLETYLEKVKPEIWRRLHNQAYRLYEEWAEEWAKEYPEGQQRWQGEIQYHAVRLRDTGYEPG